MLEEVLQLPCLKRMPRLQSSPLRIEDELVAKRLHMSGANMIMRSSSEEKTKKNETDRSRARFLDQKAIHILDSRGRLPVVHVKQCSTVHILHKHRQENTTMMTQTLTVCYALGCSAWNGMCGCIRAVLCGQLSSVLEYSVPMIYADGVLTTVIAALCVATHDLYI
jgi:hypothetical protein